MLYTSRQDVCIAGGGIIGLSLALELERRGAKVVVLEARSLLNEASVAAAGMLAANDPENPVLLGELARLSAALYPAYLEEIRASSSLPVELQTELTLQSFRGRGEDGRATLRWSGSMDRDAIDDGELLTDVRLRMHGVETVVQRNAGRDFHWIAEHSIDPRQLASALHRVVIKSSIEVVENSRVVGCIADQDGLRVTTGADEYRALAFVDCTGAWAQDEAYRVRPMKGQMLLVEGSADLDVTVRTPEIYIVPRRYGRDAGRTLIGATVEDVGFDTVVHRDALEGLLLRASELLPALAEARVVESWAGLRPATLDGLPLLGAHPSRPRQFVATGHYRNGILLAPVTAVVMADLIEQRAPTVDLKAFSPDRFVSR